MYRIVSDVIAKDAFEFTKIIFFQLYFEKFILLFIFQNNKNLHPASIKSRIIFLVDFYFYKVER